MTNASSKVWFALVVGDRAVNNSTGMDLAATSVLSIAAECTASKLQYLRVGKQARQDHEYPKVIAIRCFP